MKFQCCLEKKRAPAGGEKATPRAPLSDQRQQHQQEMTQVEFIFLLLPRPAARPCSRRAHIPGKRGDRARSSTSSEEPQGPGGGVAAGSRDRAHAGLHPPGARRPQVGPALGRRWESHGRSQPQAWCARGTVISPPDPKGGGSPRRPPGGRSGLCPG